MKRWFLFIGLLLGLLWPAPAAALEPIRVIDQRVEAVFREHITFVVNLESDSPITSVRLLYRVKGLPATARGDATFEPGTQVEASYSLDQTRYYLPPGTELDYWWRITDEAGHSLKTEPQPYLYMDDTHDWNVLQNERLALYWYAGGDSLGQQLFEHANHTLDQIETEAGVRVKDAVKIFVYGSHADLMAALEVGTHEWTGGQAFAEQGVVVAGIEPGDLEFGLIAVPHELTHLVIHQATANPFGDLPRWLDEGLAVYMSGELDAEWRGYRRLVKYLADSGQLMTLQTLSSSFPADSELANQAYAQSGVVVEFIIDTYGKEAMARLLQIFSEGSTYDDALLAALGVDTYGLDNAWRASIGAPPIRRPGDSAPQRPGDTAQGGLVGFD